MNRTTFIRIVTVTAWTVCAGLCGAGQLDAPAAPADANSAMHTLDDVYNRLNSNKTTNATAFTEPSAGPTSGTMHTLSDIYAIARPTQVQVTGVTNVSLAGDDGYFHKGVAYPNPRFAIGTNALGQPFDTNCVVDNLTGLMWARDTTNACGLSQANVDWTNAVYACTNANNKSYGGYSDWRLPNEKELESLWDARYTSPCLCNTAGTGIWTAGNPWNTSPSGKYFWSSSSPSNNANGWSPSMGSFGYSLNQAKTTLEYVWPVRGPVW